jgi:Protein of unknown function (DUF1761)
MYGVNYLAVIVATIVVFCLGGLWYSKSVFGKYCCAEMNMEMQKTHKAKTYTIAIIFTLVSALVFSMYLGPMPDLAYAVKAGFMVGIGFVGMCFGTNYIFSGRSYKLMLIDGGYHTLQFVVFGIIFGLWH